MPTPNRPDQSAWSISARICGTKFLSCERSLPRVSVSNFSDCAALTDTEIEETRGEGTKQKGEKELIFTSTIKKRLLCLYTWIWWLLKCSTLFFKLQIPVWTGFEKEFALKLLCHLQNLTKRSQLLRWWKEPWVHKVIRVNLNEA